MAALYNSPPFQYVNAIRVQDVESRWGDQYRDRVSAHGDIPNGLADFFSVKESSDDVASSNTSNCGRRRRRARSRAVAFLLPKTVKPLNRKPDQGCVLSGGLGARTSCTAGSFKTAEKDGSDFTVDNSLLAFVLALRR